MIDPVRPIAIEDIEAARERITGTVLRTPLVRLDIGSMRRNLAEARESAADQRLQDPGRTNAVASAVG